METFGPKPDHRNFDILQPLLQMASMVGSKNGLLEVCRAGEEMTIQKTGI